jgi:hypothetical protein
MTLPNKLILLGGGASVIEGINKGLFSWLPNTFSVGLNYSYKYINTTVNMAADEAFYNTNRKDVDKFPLYIGKSHVDIHNPGKNAYFLPPCKNYYRGCEPGIYSSTLIGLFATSLFINLMEEGTIYLLGYDYGCLKDNEGKNIIEPVSQKPYTHWYQDKFQHRGSGKLNWFTATLTEPRDPTKRISNAEKEWRVYKDETKVKIINVCLNSAIPTFPKISYDQFLEETKNESYNQDEIRAEVRKRLERLLAQQTQFRKHPPTFGGRPNIQNKKEPFTI